jgi:hypothetical protein
MSHVILLVIFPLFLPLWVVLQCFIRNFLVESHSTFFRLPSHEIPWDLHFSLWICEIFSDFPIVFSPNLEVPVLVTQMDRFHHTISYRAGHIPTYGGFSFPCFSMAIPIFLHGWYPTNSHDLLVTPYCCWSISPWNPTKTTTPVLHPEVFLAYIDQWNPIINPTIFIIPL